MGILNLLLSGAILMALGIHIWWVLIRKDDRLSSTLDDIKNIVNDELRKSREDSSRDARALREEVGRSQSEASKEVVNFLTTLGDSQRSRLDDVVKSTNEVEKASRQEISSLKDKISEQFDGLRKSNEEKLDQMRVTVDERLQSTLEKRLGESFTLVSERLEAVQRGLGEMQTLATGVGDLKKVLSNIKVRGTWGEVQLESILEQILTADQYERNVRVREGSAENVEFAVKLPGADESSSDTVYLPVDSKFPKEDYEKLIGACAKVS